MPDSRRPSRLATLAVLGLLAAGCTVEPGSFPSQREPLALPDAPSPTPAFGLLSDHGVTPDEPCPEPVNPDNGCIHLGALVETSGPFGTQGRAATDGAIAFWDHVNHQGGVTHTRDDGIEAAFDVAVAEHVEETGSDVEAHVEAYERIEPEVLALALSQGTAATYELLPRLQHSDMVTVPLSWWSGWGFEPLVAESGADYCFQAINGMDWAMDELGGDARIDHVVVVRGPGRYGEDVLKGVEHWVDPDASGDHPRVPFAPAEHTVVLEPGGDVAPAVERIDAVRPDVVVLATAPAQTAAIAADATARGWDGLLVGAAPTWAPSLLDDPAAAEALAGRFLHVAPVGPLTQGGKAYTEMRDVLGLGEDREIDAGAADLPSHPAWVAGWVSQYPLHHALREAIAAGDLTRAGMAHAIEEVAISYDGALPTTHYGGAPQEQATRRVFVSEVDRDAPHGLRLVGDAYVGDTAEARYVTRPCTGG